MEDKKQKNDKGISYRKMLKWLEAKMDMGFAPLALTTVRTAVGRPIHRVISL